MTMSLRNSRQIEESFGNRVYFDGQGQCISFRPNLPRVYLSKHHHQFVGDDVYLTASSSLRSAHFQNFFGTLDLIFECLAFAFAFNFLHY
jgi:hypothetical protein